MSDLSRRHFLQGTLGAAAAPLVLRGPLFGADAPSNRLNLAIIGPGGRGKDNLKEVAKGNNIVALCDVDDERAGQAYE